MIQLKMYNNDAQKRSSAVPISRLIDSWRRIDVLLYKVDSSVKYFSVFIHTRGSLGSTRKQKLKWVFPSLRLYLFTRGQYIISQTN